MALGRCVWFLYRSYQFFVFKVLSVNELDDRIAEKVRVFAVIESKTHFIEIGREMLRIHFMPRPNDAALKQGKGRLDCIRVNVAVSVLARVIDRAMLVSLHFVQRERVDRGFIREDDFNVASQIGFDDPAHSVRSGILRVDESKIAIALPNPNDHFFVTAWTPTALLPAHVCFVYLYGAAEWFWRYFLHSLADAVAEIPRCLV